MLFSLQLVAPIAVLGVAGLVLLVRPLGGVFVAGQALALAALARLWAMSEGGSLTQAIYRPLPGFEVGLGVDHVGLGFAAAGVGVALLAGLPWLARPRAGVGAPLAWLVLAEAAMVNGVMSSTIEALAAAWAMAMVAVLAAARASRGSEAWGGFIITTLLGGWVLLLAGALVLQSAGGTGAFESIPVSAMDIRAALLLCAAPVLGYLSAGAILRAVRGPVAAGVAVAAVVAPFSGYLLTRVYEIGGGRLPSAALGVGLTAGGGVVALALVVASLWAVDLGSALLRLVEAAAALLVAAAGLGDVMGVAALALGSLGLGLGSLAAMAMVEAGAGRLPGAPAGYVRYATPGLVLLVLAWAGGLPAALGLRAHLEIVRGALDAGPVVLVSAIPSIAALVVLPVAAYGCGRFGGGAPASGEPLTRFMVAAIALPAVSILGAVVLPGALVGPVAQVLRIGADEARSGLGAAIIGDPAEAILAVVLAAAAVAAGVAGLMDARTGLPRAPAFLPPRRVVVAAIAARRAWRSASEIRRRAGIEVSSRTGLVTAGLWVAAASVVVAALR